MIIPGLSMVIGAIVEMNVEAGWEKARRKETVVKLLRRFNLSPGDPPTDFDGIYTYTLIEYGTFKPEQVLNFFRNEFIRKAFHKSYYEADPSVLNEEAEGIIQWNEETGKLGRIDYDPRREFAAFSAVFNEIVDRTRTPAEARRDQKLEDIHADLHQRTGEILERLDAINTLEEIRAELARLGSSHQTERSRDESSDQSGRAVAADMPVLSAIPAKDYRYFVGRQAELHRVLTNLRDLGSKSVALTGLGGIGKTALAQEVIERAKIECLFDHIVWTSGKSEYFIAEQRQQVPADELTFDSVLVSIGHQCGRPDIPGLTQPERRDVVRALLANQKVLVVMDNLDTVSEAEGLVGELLVIIGQSKALVTSRHLLRDERIHTVTLEGLSRESGREFLRHEADARGVEAVLTASDTNLNRIHKTTGGAPLAMRLVVGQMSRQTMEQVLDALETASVKGQDYEFYHFVFRRSWEILDLDAQKALVTMSVYPAGKGGPVGIVKENYTCTAAAGAEPIERVAAAFDPAMDQLVTMSLVNKTGPAGRERYALHHLTRYFVKSDITKEWAAE